jgi:hypothetical protein
MGGDWHSRHVAATILSVLEAEWISRLVQEAEIS